MNKKTFFAYPSFIQGTASVLDIGGTLQEYNLPIDDKKALRNDWEEVGQDIASSIAKYEEEPSKSSE